MKTNSDFENLKSCFVILNSINLFTMKNLHKFLLLLFLFTGMNIFAQNTKGEVWVNGECGMCKDRIESTAKSQGAISADWNAETKMLKVEFNAEKTSLDRILKKIAEVGHHH